MIPWRPKEFIICNSSLMSTNTVLAPLSNMSFNVFIPVGRQAPIPVHKTCCEEYGRLNNFSPLEELHLPFVLTFDAILGDRKKTNPDSVFSYRRQGFLRLIQKALNKTLMCKCNLCIHWSFKMSANLQHMFAILIKKTEHRELNAKLCIIVL